MKNKIKLIGIIAFVAIIGFGLFTSCEVPEEDIINFTVTGLSAYEGQYGYAWLFADNASVLDNNARLAYSTRRVLIKDGEVHFEMDDIKSGKAFGKEARYQVLVAIYVNTTTNDPTIRAKGTETLHKKEKQDSFDWATRFTNVD